MRNPIFQYWRILACFCIVLHHTICMFSGVWPPIGHSLVDIMPEWVESLSAQSKAFGLTGFTFISGAVLAYSNNKKYTFLYFVWHKIKRILIPALIFGGLYWLMFPSLMASDWPAPINGTHLWYLPMILVCMLLTSTHIYLNNAIFLILLVYFIDIKLMSYISFRTVYELYYYFPIFYTGYIVNTMLTAKEKISNFVYKPTRFNRPLLIIIVLLCIVFYAKIIKWFGKIPNLSTALLCGLVYIAIYNLLHSSITRNAIKWCGTKCSSIKEKWGEAIIITDRNCFAIYMLSQFILNLWALLGASLIHHNNIYLMIVIVCATTFFGALGISELYDKIVMLIHKKRNEN